MWRGRNLDLRTSFPPSSRGGDFWTKMVCFLTLLHETTSVFFVGVSRLTSYEIGDHSCCSECVVSRELSCLSSVALSLRHTAHVHVQLTMILTPGDPSSICLKEKRTRTGHPAAHTHFNSTSSTCTHGSVAALQTFGLCERQQCLSKSMRSGKAMDDMKLKSSAFERAIARCQQRQEAKAVDVIKHPHASSQELQRQEAQLDDLYLAALNPHVKAKLTEDCSACGPERTCFWS